jgi:nitronate monooxygenase
MGVMARFNLADMAVPVIGAPMAGGPSTPELGATITNAGGLGVLAAGLLTPQSVAENLETARRLTSGPLGVNLFVPQPSAIKPGDVEAYAAALTCDAQRCGVPLGEPRYTDDGWAAKLQLVLDMRPEVVSFTFGAPGAKDCTRLREVGVATIGTVTTPQEAQMAVARGVDAVVVQGPSAGGHRGTFDATAQPSGRPLWELLAAVIANVDVPVIAAGGLATAADVGGATVAGAVAAQLGTAFLLADEAGTEPAYRTALGAGEFTETVVTKAFTGRNARALRNRFVDEHDGDAPFGFPEVALLTSPLLKAAANAGDPHGMSLWAGTAFQKAKAGSVAEIMEGLIP